MGEILAKSLAMIETTLITPLIWLFPFKWSVVPPGSAAVRFTLGHPSKDLGVGTHVAFTCQTLTKMHVATRPTAAESMYVLTSDGLSLRVRGVTLYAITNLGKFLTCSEDSEQLMIDTCEAATKVVISRVPFADLIYKSADTEKAIASVVGEIGRATGIKVKRFRLQDVEIVDPLARALSSSEALTPGLVKAAGKLVADADVSMRDALMILSPNVTFTVDMAARGTQLVEAAAEEETEE